MNKSHTNFPVMAIAFLAFALAALPNFVMAAVLDVPDTYNTIQAAIDASGNGDEIQIAANTYYEDILIDGKSITITGDPENPENVIIDANGAQRVVTFAFGQSDGAVLKGFTLQNGVGQDIGGGNTTGGGIFFGGNSTVTVEDCIIRQNTAQHGAGVVVTDGGDPTLIRCVIEDNHASVNTGGVWIRDGRSATLIDCVIRNNSSSNWCGGMLLEAASHVDLTRCIIADNSANNFGGGMFLISSSANLENCTVSGNTVNNNGGAIFSQASQLAITNSIIWSNSPNEIRVWEDGGPSTLNISYTDLTSGQNGIIGNNINLTWGNGNIDADPSFADADNGNFNLLADSPCINAADPNSADDIDGTTPEMGALYFDATLLNVPDIYATIQAAIDVADAGDTVLVAPGTYYENLVVNEGHLVNLFSNYAISGNGNDIWNTIIDGDGGQIMNVTGSDSPVHLKGLVIQNGVGNFGGAIATSSDLSLTICVLRNNNANVSGGVISAFGAVPKTITSANCTYMNNNAQDYGGVFFLNNVNLDSDHDLIFGNTAGVGGVLGQHNPPINISFNFCTVVDNSDNTGVGGMWNYGMYGDNGNNYPNQITITNSIFRNVGYEAANLRTVAGHRNIYNISYSDFDTDGGNHGILETAAFDLNWGIGNFDTDPQLDGNHVITANSPCIDAADPNADVDADGTRADMGYYYSNHAQGPRTRYVPGVYATIQGAIDAASAGDNVLVAAGTYNENINFNGQNVTVTGNPDNPADVIIDGGENGTVVKFENEESNQAILAGFTITNGLGVNNLGGGILCGGASTPLIQHCIITGNTADYDGGISVLDGSIPTFEFCTVSNNYAVGNDGGFGVHGGGATFNDCSIISNSSGSQTGGINVEGNATLNMTRCVIADNSAPVIGGGFLLWGGHINLTNCVVYGNTAGDDAGAIHLIDGSSATLVNSIIWGNSPNGIVFRAEGFQPSTATISYSDIEGGVNGVVTNNNGQLNWGNGNFNANPLFADAGNGDFNLKYLSTCIDAGDPNAGLDPNGSRTDMGAFFFDGVIPTPWWLTIGAHSQNANDTENNAGGAPFATLGYDPEWDVPEPPHAQNNWISLAFPHPEFNNELFENFSGDYQPYELWEEGAMIWNFQVSSDLANQPISLSAEPVQLPFDYNEINIGLVDLELGVFDNLRANITDQTNTASFTFGEGGGTRQFRLIVNDTEGPNVAFTTPTAAEEVVCGYTYAIQWTAQDIATISANTLSVSFDEGVNWNLLGEFDGATFEYQWNVTIDMLGAAILKVVSLDGFENASEATVSFTIIDVPPVVTVTYPNGGEHFEAGNVVHITWNQTDNVGVVGNSIHIWSNDALGYDEVIVLENVATSYDWTAPDIYSPFMQIEIIAIDASDLQGNDQSDGEFAVTPIRLVHQFDAGWTLFSIPLQNNDYTNETLFGDDIDGPFNLFAYSDDGFHRSGGRWGNQAIDGETWRGDGYWMALNDELTLDVEGQASLGEYWWGWWQTGRTLELGWNLVGCPYPTEEPLTGIWFDGPGGTLAFQDAVDAGWILPTVYGYSSVDGYVQSNSLMPWQGFWIKTLQNVTMKMVPSRNLGGEPAPFNIDPTPEFWQLEISATMQSASDQITHLGVSEDATESFDVWFDQPEPPNPPGRDFVSAYFSHDDWEQNLGNRFNSDVRAPIAAGNSDEWTLTIATGDTGMVTLNWDQLGRSVPEGFEITLIDIENEREVNLNEEESYAYFSDLSHTFGVIVTAPEGGPGTRDLHIPLRNGWSIISMNVRPGDEFYRAGEDRGPDIKLILNQLSDEEGNSPVYIFKDEDGRFYIPSLNFSNIPFWDLSQGYQIRVNSECELVQSGEPITANTPVQLENGWNLIAYYPDYELSARAPQFDVLSSIIDDVRIAKNQSGQFMLPRSNFSNMLPWKEGMGYQVMVSRAVELVYPDEGIHIGAKSGEQNNLLPIHWNPPVSTGRNMSLLITGFAGIEVNPGDEMAAFDKDGALVGWGMFDADRKCGLAVWGDDTDLDGKQGLSEDEEFTLKLWQSSNQTELTIEPRKILEGKGLVYVNNEFSMIEVRAAEQIPIDFALYGAFPNPFNATATISYGLPEKTNVRLSVVNVSGQTVSVLQSGEREAGRYDLRWNAESLSSGVYFIRLEAGNFLAHKKINLIK